MIHPHSRLVVAPLHPRLYEQLRDRLRVAGKRLMLLDAALELRGEVVCLLNY